MRGVNWMGCVLMLSLLSCDHELKKIESAENRVEEAISSLTDELTAPALGWKVYYQPTSSSGVFLVLLNFNQDGTVRIQSDEAAENGYYFDQTIPYRVDVQLSTQLIFESYAVFHYLFELEQSTFEAEFEFIYDNKSNDNLNFYSKSDSGIPSTFEMIPAQASDVQLLGQQEVMNLNAFNTEGSFYVGSIQQLKIPERNMSIFLSMSVTSRVIELKGVATGLTLDEIEIAGSSKVLSGRSGYGFSGSNLIITDPLSFTFESENFEISSLELLELSFAGLPLCEEDVDLSPVYEIQLSGLGAAELSQSFIDIGGFSFSPQADVPYGVNVFFVFDSEGRSLSSSGSIGEYFPEATGLVFNYGLQDDALPQNAIGITTLDENDQRVTIFRGFDMISAKGNMLEIKLTDNYYPDTLSDQYKASLALITNEILGSDQGVIHAGAFEIEGQEELTLYSLYNPCNNYEFILVQ